VAPRVRLEIAKITLQQKSYAQARQLLKEIVGKEKQAPAVAAQAQSEIARSFELEGRWDLAMNEYRWLSQQYETFPLALAAPLHIANYYIRVDDRKLAEKAFGDAVSFYQSIIGKYPKSVVAGIAQEHIANCFMAQKKWDEAINAASNIDKVLDNNVGRVSSYLLLGAIHESRGQSQLAVKVYREFMERFPQHPLAQALKDKVEALTNS
jgi:tetratricopeptide (TPR) repeat protein